MDIWGVGRKEKMEEKGGGQKWHLVHPADEQDLSSSVALGEPRTTHWEARLIF